jgi:PAS domain S-box-containing protein
LQQFDIKGSANFRIEGHEQLLISSVVLISKFAQSAISKSCELRNHGTGIDFDADALPPCRGTDLPGLVPASAADFEPDHIDRALLDALPAAVYMTDARGRIIYYNEAAAELWGCRPELGKSEWCGSWKLLTSEGHPLAHDECPMAIAIKEGRSIKGAEAVAERPDGTRIPFLSFPTPMRDRSGKLVGAMNVLIDISQYKRAEEMTYRLAAIVESSDDAIVSKNLDGIVTSWNQGAERLFGYSSDEMIGKPISTVIPKERMEEEYSILARVRRGERVDHFDTIRHHKNGSRIAISLTVSPIRNAAGTIIGASKIARNISDRKENEQRIRMLMLEVNHRVKNQFAVILSMVRETNKHTSNSAEFEAQLRERIMALSRSQDLLVRGEWRGATLHDLIADQAIPFGSDGRIRVIGEPLVLSAPAVQALGMALHELATNSAKHGSLSGPRGQITIEWNISAEKTPMFQLTWREMDGPAVGEITRGGFGKVVLERVVPASLNGVGRLSYPPTGASWTLEAPLASVEAIPIP